MAKGPNEVLASLCDTIENTGGVFEDSGGRLALVADPDWFDLADVYDAACGVLDRKAMVVDAPEWVGKEVDE